MLVALPGGAPCGAQVGARGVGRLAGRGEQVVVAPPFAAPRGGRRSTCAHARALWPVRRTNRAERDDPQLRVSDWGRYRPPIRHSPIRCESAGRSSGADCASERAQRVEERTNGGATAPPPPQPTARAPDASPAGAERTRTRTAAAATALSAPARDRAGRARTRCGRARSRGCGRSAPRRGACGSGACGGGSRAVSRRAPTGRSPR